MHIRAHKNMHACTRAHARGEARALLAWLTLLDRAGIHNVLMCVWTDLVKTRTGPHHFQDRTYTEARKVSARLTLLTLLCTGREAKRLELYGLTESELEQARATFKNSLVQEAQTKDSLQSSTWMMRMMNCVQVRFASLHFLLLLSRFLSCSLCLSIPSGPFSFSLSHTQIHARTHARMLTARMCGG